MPAQLTVFPSENGSTLRVFCPNPEIVFTSFESYLPDPKDIGKLFGEESDLPARLCWLKEEHEYYAYLPKERPFEGHLLEPLKRYKLEYVQKDGRWFLDEETRKLWGSLDDMITSSINIVRGELLTELEHYQPRKAIDFGFTRGHKTIRGVQISAGKSKRAFVHRLAYLAYMVSRRYEWDVDLVNQEWWRDLRARCGRTWLDSVWDRVYRQWKSRDFVGIAIGPVSCSIRWLRPALKFGVPIWVFFPGRHTYEKLDGGFIMKIWLPTEEQVSETRRTMAAEFKALNAGSTANPSLSCDPMDLSPDPCANLPAESSTDEHLGGPTSKSLLPPPHIPQGSRWYASWETFFREREEADGKRFEAASNEDKQAWKSREKNAEKHQAPGKSGARVHTWEACDSGGFFRILQDRSEVAESWGFWHKEALIYNPRQNVWDYCPFKWAPAVEDGSPDDDYDDDDDDYNNFLISERWYTEPAPPATLPEANPSPLEFLYRRYGFLSMDLPDANNLVFPLTKASAYRIVGLEPESGGEDPRCLDRFISQILSKQLPGDHCDLSETSPPNEMFHEAWKKAIRNTVFLSNFMELFNEGVGFLFVGDDDDPRRLVLHDSLTVLEVARAGTSLKLEAQLNYLLINGSQFTVLYPVTRPPVPPNFNILTFPVRDETWKPDTEDFQAYMSRLRALFHERPYVAAAAFSRGGIAWRIAWEVLGIEGSLDTLTDIYPDKRSPVSTKGGTYWFHNLQEGEWYFLVGGYEVLTGKGDQRKDLSWWPKVTTWEGSGIDVGCWTPMCERWFRKRLELIKTGKTEPYTSTQWQKNLRYDRRTRDFFRNWKIIGQNFLKKECLVETM